MTKSEIKEMTMQEIVTNAKANGFNDSPYNGVYSHWNFSMEMAAYNFLIANADESEDDE